jgi:tetratricopeptide (TPR) repeat protein
MKRFALFFLLSFWFVSNLSAQINADQMIRIGRNALYFEDYVLSIQYFNQAIKSKPHLAEPYFFRAVAKLYLDDYAGAEEDCSLALDRNSFMVKAYLCRSYARMRLEKFNEAVEDCNKGLEFDSQNKNLLYNKGFALVSAKRYDEARVCLDEMSRRFPMDVDSYMARGRMNVERGDTLSAIDDFSRAISVDRFNPQGWGARGWVYLLKDNYANALADFNEAIQLKSDDASYFMNRAVARYNLNDLRGTMEDFDRTISLDPNSKLSYLNRAILRTTVGDLNRALEDYDKVLSLDPEDIQVKYNRGIVRKDLGKYKDAIADFTSIINRYPNFVPAYRLRSEAKRALGDAKGADRDYFAAWNLEEKAKQLRNASKKKSTTDQAADTTEKTFDFKKFKRMIASETQTTVDEKYENPMRGRVQDKIAEIELEGMFKLTYYEKVEPGLTRLGFDLEKYMGTKRLIANRNIPRLLMTNSDFALSTKQAEVHFQSIDEYSRQIGLQPENPSLFFGRSLDFFLVQDLGSAMSDMDRAIQMDNAFLLAYFERAYFRYRKMSVDYANKEVDDNTPQQSDNLKSTRNSSTQSTAKSGELNLGEKIYGTDLDLLFRDLNRVLELDPNFYFAYYNRGYIRCMQRDYRNALLDFSKAIEINPDFSDAWFNRGITQIFLGERSKGMADLRMAGQLGNYKAYSILKRLGSD